MVDEDEILRCTQDDKPGQQMTRQGSREILRCAQDDKVGRRMTRWGRMTSQGGFCDGKLQELFVLLLDIRRLRNNGWCPWICRPNSIAAGAGTAANRCTSHV